jgi:von Willebrand factor type A C-terminal domain/von Willebrand factor type A domain
MTSLPGFTVDIDHNPYLSPGGRDVSAVVTVTADQSGDEPGPAGDSAEIIIVDRSNSMGMPISKVVQAWAATAAAVDVIRDGAWFAIIGGAGSAERVYPANGMMAVADERTREEAKQAVRKLGLRGGTAMSAWLRLAYQTFQSCPATLRHAILLTDGPNIERRNRRLDAAIEQCEGAFRCDCRGVGTDWQVSELRKISTALLGTVDIVPDPAGLAADFREMMRGAMSKRLPDVLLRVRTPQQATLRFVKQVAPAIDDLTARRVQSGPQVGDYPTGAWAPGETRDYHVGIRVNTPDVGQEMLAARVSLVASSPDGQQVLGQGLIMAERTNDEELSTRVNQRVTHYTGQEELADAIRDGLEVSKRGDGETATARLGRAVALAHRAGNADTARLLSKVVDVVDEATGTVRLKKKVEAADQIALDIRSTKTVRAKKELP